jgi:triosephosphate isomerase
MKTPAIVINFKAYEESLGKKSLELAKMAEKVWKEKGVTIAVAPQLVDLRTIVSEVEVPVFAQALDQAQVGAFTGFTTLQAIKDAGADGFILNHSERRVNLSLISEAVNYARSLKLISLICADTADTTGAVSSLNPDFVAIEPPELIGTGIPVSKAKPEVVTGSIDRVRRVGSTSKVICGAGITTAEDVRAALKLGTVGVLLASGVVKAKDPLRVISEMADACL